MPVNPSTWEAEAGGLQVWSQSRPYGKNITNIKHNKNKNKGYLNVSAVIL
jgi:hypothetical protein